MSELDYSDKTKQIPALDSVRGVAILLVLASHTNPFFVRTVATIPMEMVLTFGWCGVDLFFVLSGFLITRILIRTRNADNRCVCFYARRFLRIFPVYYLVLMAVFVASFCSPTVNELTRLPSHIAYLPFFGFLQNWLVLWKPVVIRNGLIGHFWSLAVEEQFYLLWPLVVWRVKTCKLPQLCFGVALAALVSRILLVHYFGPHYWIHALTPTRGEGLLLGSGFAALSETRRIANNELAAVAVLGGGLLGFILLTDPLEFLNTDAGPYMYTIGITGLGLLFSAFVSSCDRRVPLASRALDQTWLRRFGKYSYGMYVFHIPIYVFAGRLLTSCFRVKFPLSVPLALIYVCCLISISYAFAWCSFTFFESRFLALKNHFIPNKTVRWKRPDTKTEITTPADSLALPS